ncbi:MAG: entericidin A/B family lipoprotein [Candidatus Andeanibacterium colombiense]|uniref:Entericidin A/B family lipoprotein n=1 Tax=Candidatus Andeanibacterium colombiense TaxID=3121345 RepID=A0AAJ6BQN3_9SPHN|nr:MAG: entericidin A/B family lipoprotein [Sphingomonadaceae bacterium]
MIRNSKLAKLMLAISLTSLALGTAACNTVKGVGKDIQSAGQAGDDAIHGK